MTAGQLLYKYLFKPTLPLRYNLTHFGLAGYLHMARGERAMKKAAARLRPITLTADVLLECSYLTGKKYWHQTIFCACSLARALQGRVKIKIYSDGTLTARHAAVLKTVLKNVILIYPEEVEQQLQQKLPQDHFPALHFLRNWHPFFKRIIDIHCTPGWSMHLDSDMLFLNYPGELVEAYQNKAAVYMKESMPESYYVDQESALQEKYGISCVNHLNGGIVAYDNDRVDYADLEQKAQLMIDRYLPQGPARVEQTLMSYMLYRQNATALAEALYTIYYDADIQTNAQQAVRHYIFKAKLPYLHTEWKALLP